jgi:hypothetical protein
MVPPRRGAPKKEISLHDPLGGFSEIACVERGPSFLSWPSLTARDMAAAISEFETKTSGMVEKSGIGSCEQAQFGNFLGVNARCVQVFGI